MLFKMLKHFNIISKLDFLILIGTVLEYKCRSMNLKYKDIL